MLRDEADWCATAKERRGALRIACVVPASLVSSAMGRPHETVLVDLSQTGCRIRTRVRCHRGDHAVLTIGTIGPRAVVAAWRGEGEVGLAFAQPLAWTVVEQLAVPAGGGGVSPAPI